MTAKADVLYRAVLAQLAAESYLDDVNLTDRNAFGSRLINGNNHHLDPLRPSITVPPESGLGGTRITEKQLNVFVEQYDIIDHLPNQASGFSATLLKNKATGEYTLAFRSTEYRSIENGGDAERDSIRGAAGDIAFNGMAFAQVSSMEKYWASLLDGSRARGATPDNTAANDTAFIRSADLQAFAAAAASGARINVSGYSLGGHLATVFSTFHGEAISSLYLFNSSGVGRIRDGFPATTYRDALAMYDTHVLPQNLEAAVAKALDWAGRVSSAELLGAKIRLLVPEFTRYGFGQAFVPEALQPYLSAALDVVSMVKSLAEAARAQIRDGLPHDSGKRPIVASSAQHFLVSLFASEALEGTYAQTVRRGLGTTFPSLQEIGLIPATVRIHQISGMAAAGAPSTATFGDMVRASDWNIVADSGIRAAPDSELQSVYIEDQPIASGWPLSESGWGDFGNTHSVTLIVDSLAVLRMLQNAQPSLSQQAAELVFRAASNLRKERYRADRKSVV